MIDTLLHGRSLRLRILVTSLLAFLSAIAIFFALRGIGWELVVRRYLSEDRILARSEALCEDFRSYSQENALRSTDRSALAQWARLHPRGTLYLFQGQRLAVLIEGGQVSQPNSANTLSSAQANAECGMLLPLRLQDGVFQLAARDHSELRQYVLVTILSLLAAFFVFFWQMLRFVTILTNRIIRLSQETRAVSSGDLNAAITAVGEDELSRLAGDVDAMRTAIIERMGSEHRAWQANSELITAISHDIRTPMTALLGYLELLRRSGQDEETVALTLAAYGKGVELKELTDELFRYFLVFGKSEPELHCEMLDASLFAAQLLGEAAFELTDAGFTVHELGFEGEGTIEADPLYLKRVIDNLVSNVRKYADREQPVIFLTTLSDGKLTVSISNAVRADSPQVESTKIGIRTCERILTQMGGTIRFLTENGRFAAEFSLPCAVSG